MKLALINCYYGKMPIYFNLWLQSCSKNAGIDFFLVTDATISGTIPNNVKVIAMSWEELITLFQSKFDFPITIESAYKLTDFKPAYGYVFQDFLAEYDYWGYCDLDLIFGNVLRFIGKPMEDGTEKIYRWGHLTLLKNTDRMNQLFRQKGGVFSYREVFSRPEFFSFDEHSGLMLIAKKQEIQQYYQEDMADISCRIRRMTASRCRNYPFQIFYYEDGAVFRAYIENERVQTEEFSYIHLQKRKYVNSCLNNCFFILADHFEEKEPGIPNNETIRRLSGFISEEADRRQLISFRNKKIKEFFDRSWSERWIWIKIKAAERKVLI